MNEALFLRGEKSISSFFSKSFTVSSDTRSILALRSFVNYKYFVLFPYRLIVLTCLNCEDNSGVLGKFIVPENTSLSFPNQSITCYLRKKEIKNKPRNYSV